MLDNIYGEEKLAAMQEGVSGSGPLGYTIEWHEEYYKHGARDFWKTHARDIHKVQYFVKDWAPLFSSSVGSLLYDLVSTFLALMKRIRFQT